MKPMRFHNSAIKKMCSDVLSESDLRTLLRVCMWERLHGPIIEYSGGLVPLRADVATMEDCLPKILAQVSRNYLGTSSDVAAVIGCSDRAVRKARLKGYLPGCQVGSRWLYSVEAVDAWHDQRSRSPHSQRYLSHVSGIPRRASEAPTVIGHALLYAYAVVLTKIRNWIWVRRTIPAAWAHGYESPVDTMRRKFLEIGWSLS